MILLVVSILIFNLPWLGKIKINIKAFTFFLSFLYISFLALPFLSEIYFANLLSKIFSPLTLHNSTIFSSPLHTFPISTLLPCPPFLYPSSSISSPLLLPPHLLTLFPSFFLLPLPLTIHYSLLFPSYTPVFPPLLSNPLLFLVKITTN